MRCTLSLVLLGSFAVGLLGCDDPPPGPGRRDGGPRRDAGTEIDAGTDAGPGADASVDAGSDAGTDAGVDAGPRPDAGPAPWQSRLTAYVSGRVDSVLTLTAVDSARQPLAFTAGATFDSSVPPDGFAEAYLWVEDRIYTYSRITGTEIFFDLYAASVDGSGTPLAPDVVTAGEIELAGGPTFIGIFGTDARIYDFGANTFGPPIALQETGPIPFAPQTITTADLGLGGGESLLALKAGSRQPYLFNTTSLLFEAVGPLTETCTGPTALSPTLLVAAPFSAFTVAPGADSVVIFEGSNAYGLESTSPVCYSDAYALLDAYSDPIDPDIVLAADLNEDGPIDLLMIENFRR